MLNETEKKIDTYIGLSLRKGALYVGRQLEEMLVRKKISLLVILPCCPSKTEKHLTDISIGSDLVKYQGSMNLALSCGYEALNAFGISDRNLASALKKHLENKEDNL